MTAAVEFQEVDILFARQPGRAGRNAMRDALAALDGGASRADIQGRFGVVKGRQFTLHDPQKGVIPRQQTGPRATAGQVGIMA